MKKLVRLAALVLVGGCLEIKDAPCNTDADCVSGQVCVPQGDGKSVCKQPGSGGGAAAGGMTGGSGGATAGGVAGGGDAGGLVGGGDAGGIAGGNTAGGNVAGGDTAGGSTAGGDTAGGSTAGGDTAGGSTAGGSTAGGSTAGGSTAGGSMAGGATAGGSMGGGSAGGSAGGFADDGGIDDGGVANLTLSDMNLAFGSVTSGTQSMPTTVTVTNSGTQPSGAVTLTPGGPDMGAFVVRNSTCTGALGPSGTCQFNVVFAPTSTGAKTAFLTVLANPGGGGTISLTGTGAFPAAITIAPTPFDYPGVAQGTASSAQPFTVTNTGGTPTGTLSISYTGPDGAMFATASGGNCAASLAPAGRCTVNVTFTPTSTGAKQGVLTVTDSGGIFGTASLRGTGLTPAAITGPALVSFPDTLIGQPSANVVVTITNTGQVATPLLSLSLGGTNPTEFSRVPSMDTCTGTAVAPGTCTVNYRFTPAGAGLRSATLSVSGGSLTPVTIRLEGVGLNPAQLAFATNTLDLGSAVQGGAASTAVIGLNNSGDVLSGAPTFTPSPSPEFTVSMSTCSGGVPARGSCSVTVAFAAAASGNRAGSLSASATPGGTTPSITLSGIGIAPGALSISPTSRYFGSVVMGTAVGLPTQTFTVTNTGGTTLTAVNLAVVTGASASFVLSNTVSLTPCGGNLAPGGQCGGIVTFNPAFIGANGSFLRATSGTNTAQATLSGVGLRPASLTPQSPSVNFGAVVLGQLSAPVPFTLVNDGDVPSGPVSLTISPSAGFAFDAGSCGPGVDAGLSCSGSLTFQPSAAGNVSSTVTVVASPGGGQTFTANGNGITPAALTLAPESGSSANYGNVLLNTTFTQRFTVTNTGQQASGPLSLGMSGTNGSQWQVASGTGDCQLGQPLPPGGSCTSSVRFTASSAGGRGMKTGILTASATPGTAPSLTLTANVQSPAQLTTSVTNQSFGGQEVSLASPGFSWVITNSGDVATGSLSISNTNPTDFVTSGCTGTLAGSTSCTLTVTFRPQAGGASSGVITVGATPGGSVTLNVDGRGQWRLTVNANVANTLGTVGTTDNLITGCGSPGCSMLYDHNISVTVRATNVALSGRHFATFSTPTTCNVLGNGRDCTVTMDQPRTVSAAFLQTFENLAFVTSTTHAANLGSAAAYDTACNTVATSAGLNNSTNNAFVAWLSDSSSVTITSRLGTGKGAFRRVDNTLFSTSETNLLANQVLSPLNLDEYGRLVSAAQAFTGTLPNGAVNTGQNCSTWTSTTATNDFGLSTGGPGRWTQAFTGGCATSVRLFCLQRTSTTTAILPTIPTGGKIIYLTAAAYTPVAGGSLASLDAHCNLTANKPSAYVGRTFVAFAATTTATAASRLTATSSYYRPDGHFVGTGADLATGGARLPNGIWQDDDLNYATGLPTVWTGATNATTLATATTNCNNWSAPTSTATVANANSLLNYFNFGFNQACNVGRSVYCAEP